MFRYSSLDPNYPVCPFCMHSISDETNSVSPCRCGTKCHQACLDKNVQYALNKRNNMKKSIRQFWPFWLLFPDKYKEITTHRESFDVGEISVHDRKSLTIGFVNHTILSPCILPGLELSYTGVNDSITVMCPKCACDITIYGKKSKVHAINEVLNKLKCGSLIITSASFLASISLTTMFSVAGFLAPVLSWHEDFFKVSDTFEITELFRFALVPHYVYTMASPNVGLMNLLISTVYSTFGYGIPAYGITKQLQNFVYTKLIFTVFYRLTLNRFYYESFRKTIPSLFGYKLSSRDAWAIQEYRNETPPEEYDNLSLWEKTKLWVLDTWYCLWEDFGELYRQTNWDFLLSNYGSVFSLTAGIMLGNSRLTKAIFNNIYYTDVQNEAYAKFAGLVVVQIFYFAISTFDSCSLVQCYNNLKPGEGYIPWSRINLYVRYVYLKLAKDPTEF